nr:hypothetical protein MarFTME_353 [Marseillevirus futianmevirus]
MFVFLKKETLALSDATNIIPDTASPTSSEKRSRNLSPFA